MPMPSRRPSCMINGWRKKLTDLEEAMRHRAVSQAPTLEKIRANIAWKRDLDKKIFDAEEQLSHMKEQRSNLEREVLQDQCAEAEITELTIEANENLPAYEAKLVDYYRANIAASWSAERRQAALETLEKLGLAGLLKATVTA